MANAASRSRLPLGKELLWDILSSTWRSLSSARKFPELLTTCLDTAHLFAAGFDISTAKGFWETVKKFDRIIGRERLSAWHLNDSKTGLGSRVDRHEHIGKGKIGLAPFGEIMASGEFIAIPKVLETPKKKDLKEDVENMAVLRGLLG